jgi:KUP system potassium uptake protein
MNREPPFSVTSPPTGIHLPAGARADGKQEPKGFSWRMVGLTLGSLGVVYGDIGTSPLYTVHFSVLATGGEMPMPYAVMGAVSLIFWALTIIVTVKYCVFVLRADNRGEGGVLALAAFAHRSPGLSRWQKSAIGFAAVLGLALFFGDGMLTPAITVLSAVEGIQLEAPGFAPFVLPLALIILIGLFTIQSRGTGRIGFMFGPIMVVWFATIGALGLRSIIANPGILWALNPYYGVHLFVIEPWVAFVALGSIVLAVTGVETLYADIGHFGKNPIRLAWLCIAMPGLVLNYFGQGAMILSDPTALENPFFSLSRGTLHYPMVALATVASIIASQATISGVFSLTQQAVQLGMLPRMEIRHTSATEFGQIFLPRANTLMLIGVIVIVLIFKNSAALAAAYGMAVVGMMTITTLLLITVARRRWSWKLQWMIAVFGIILLVDLSLLGSSLLKMREGAWLPLAIAAAVLMLMETWRTGRRILSEKTYGMGLATERFLERADKTPIRVAGTAIFITPRLDEVPGALLHNMKHNQVLHERVIFLRVDVQDIPFVPVEKRLTVEKLGKGFYTVEAHFGFFETPNVPRALQGARAHGLTLDIDATSFFVRRETLVLARRSAMARWRRKIFIRLYGSALQAAEFYGLPPGRVVELGSQTEF